MNMTGLEIGVLLVGVLFLLMSFFLQDKLTPSDLEEIEKLSKDEIRVLIKRELSSAEKEIHDTINQRIDDSYEELDRKTDKETNDKIKEISERYGIRISIAFDPTEEELIKTISDRYRYICVLDFEDGRIGMAVVARGKLFDLWFEMRKCLHAKSVKWYASNRAIFEKIPISLSPKCYIIDADKLLHYLTGAVELERSGDIIKQK